ncbi:MAG TPA: hypothetical protein DEO70_06495 [Bacteroidales bacterium]|nr:MAG: hypothetical protein A2X11_08540 [Bacteroidetes bacterium GWE2_42_24]OFY25486.1 MAG: hypothetical protein A2X09_14250 [Bacteroidetes bacterium GWF2_43_11]HBZ66468.1 hypothetical protein [Bacteroidales bacterium]
MKTNTYLRNLSLLLLGVGISLTAASQDIVVAEENTSHLTSILDKSIYSAEPGSEDVTIQVRETGSFSGIDVGGAFNVYISIGDPVQVKVEIDEELQSKVGTEVRGGILYISTLGSLRNPSKMNVYITVPTLNNVNAGGAATLKMVEGQTISGESLSITAHGAANIRLFVDLKEIEADISGAADVDLEGNTGTLQTEVSGAATLKAYNLVAENTDAEVSGAADARLNGSGEVSVETSGAGSVKFKNNPQSLVRKGRSETTGSRSQLVMVDDDEDTVSVNLGAFRVGVNESRGTTEVQVGKHSLIVDDDGNVKWRRNNRYRHFDGHWGGFDLSFNGYVNSDMNMNFSKADSYLDLDIPKSIGVHLNIYEQNIQLNPSGTIGLVTGLGIEWHNYRFEGNVRLDPDSSVLKGYFYKGVTLDKSKLTVSYLTLPVLFEYQNQADRKLSQFHVSAGVLLGVRIGSHSKLIYNQTDTPYELIDPATGNTVIVNKSPLEETYKQFESFHLNPFKADAMVRIGWGYINLFGTYGITTLFRSEKGPELYPFSVGIKLIGW